jgi:hypothetical protein
MIMSSAKYYQKDIDPAISFRLMSQHVESIPTCCKGINSLHGGNESQGRLFPFAFRMTIYDA